MVDLFLTWTSTTSPGAKKIHHALGGSILYLNNVWPRMEIAQTDGLGLGEMEISLNGPAGRPPAAKVGLLTYGHKV